MDLERELTCSICTDILYQPLTLLDCLHTFCGSCLQEWFQWQAQSTQQSGRRTNTHPYTCPSCRESVRGTRGGWMLATMLEGYLRAHPEKAKTEVEREDIGKRYKPGDEVLVPVQVPVEAEEDDSEDERLLRSVREMSMADVDADARRRAEREARHRRRREGEGGRSPEAQAGRRQQQGSRWAAQHAQLTEARLRQHDPEGSHIEHQPSLRSLLSASEADPQDVQAEILQSIYQEGMLEGIDLDNLTTAQEEELTERIADAYRRRQRERRRERERSRNREQLIPSRPGTAERSPPQVEAGAQQARSRPPVARPHVFEGGLQAPPRGHTRSQSSTSQRNAQVAGRVDRSANTGSPASRSATDLSLRPSSNDGQRAGRRRLSGTGRSVTDPHDGVSREHIHRMRAGSNENRPPNLAALVAGRPPTTDATHSSSAPSTHRPRNIAPPPTSVTLVASPPSSPPANNMSHPESEHAVRPAASRGAFLPEPVHGNDTNTATQSSTTPEITCTRCERPSVQHELHYNCSICQGGAFNLCLRCYREGKGCNHWFGFGFRAYERFCRSAPPEGYPPGYSTPHILTPRRYAKRDTAPPRHASNDHDTDTTLETGAFCDNLSCLRSANDGYWYCNICLEGAWGYCSACVKRGLCCTHSLVPITHIRHSHQQDPSKTAFVGLPHLRQDCYVPLPVLTDCDICTRPIPPNSSRFHCYECNDGDYDICTECYRSLVARGKLTPANGTSGWRRCLRNHRMVVIGYQDTSDGGHLRFVIRDRVGGTAFREDEISLSGREPPGGYPPDGGVGMRCLASYCYWPGEGVEDEVAFPKNAEVRECEDRNGDWFWGVYAGVGGLFPGNHVRVLGQGR